VRRPFGRFEILLLTTLLWCLSITSTWAAMSVATLNGTYHGGIKGSGFTRSIGGDIADVISGSQLSMEFLGNGNCFIEQYSQEYGVSLSSPTVVEEEPWSLPVTPCTYTVSPGGEGTISFGPIVGKFWVSADGNVLTLGNAVVEQEGDETFHDTSLGIFVKIGAGMNNASLNGTFRMVSLDSAFHTYLGGVVDFLFANNVTLTFDGVNTAMYSYDNGLNIEANLTFPSTVSTSPDTASGSGTYTVLPSGEVVITFEDGSWTAQLSSDGNTLIAGEAYSETDGDDTNYSINSNIAVKVGSGKGQGSLYTTYRVVFHEKEFSESSGSIFDEIISNDPEDGTTITFDGSGGCEVNYTDREFSVDLTSPDRVVTRYDSGTESCTYTVGPDGAVVVTFAPGDTWELQLSANNQVLLSGGPTSEVDEFESDYGMVVEVGVNTGITFPKCAQPASITVPTSDPDGSYTVSWGTSSTGGVTYVLEEALDPNYEVGLRKVYRGTGNSHFIEGRIQGGVYYYRVKATKQDHRPSGYLTGENGVVSPDADGDLIPNNIDDDDDNDGLPDNIDPYPLIFNYQARIGGSYYWALSPAFNAAVGGNTIQAQDGNFPGEGTVSLVTTGSVKFVGGFDTLFNAISGKTRLQGALLLNKGTLVVQGLEIY